MSKIEENGWNLVVPKPVQVKKKLTKKLVKVLQKSAVLRVKAMIAAKRKAAAIPSVQVSDEDKPLSLREMMAQKRTEMVTQRKDETENREGDVGFKQFV